LDRRLEVPRTGLDDVERRKIFYWDSNSDLSAVKPVASRYPGRVMI
jgi:hypothetical protein